MGLFCLTHQFVFPEGREHYCPYCKADSLSNQLELAREDIECAHLSLDDMGASRERDGKPLSIIGRVMAKYG